MFVIHSCTEWNFDKIRKTINFEKHLQPKFLEGGEFSYKPKTTSYSYIVPIIQAFNL